MQYLAGSTGAQKSGSAPLPHESGHVAADARQWSIEARADLERDVAS
jgi:hypothetical protein